MKSFNCLILLITFIFPICVSGRGKNIWTELEMKDISDMSQVLKDVIDVYYISRGIEFDFFIFKDTQSMKTETILNEILSNINERFKYKLYNYDESSCIFQPIYHQIIIFIGSIQSLICFTEQFKIIVHQNQINNIAIIEESLVPELNKFHSKINRLNLLSSSIFQHTNFIINYSEWIELSRFEWFTPNSCNFPNFTLMNLYHKSIKQWNRPLSMTKKFVDFQGCELVLMMPVLRSLIDPNIWGYAVAIEGSRTYKVHGIIPKIFEIASKKYNYKDEYQPVRPHYEISFISNPLVDNIEPIHINGTYREPNVCIEFIDKRLISQFVFIRYTVPFAEISRKFLITSSELFTSYEKLYLPFDLKTWILIVVNLFVVFILTFMNKKLSTMFEDFIYGTSALKVLRMLFGVPQIEKTYKNFSGQVMIFFVLFCLIIRVCYQSKIFQVMTSDQRHLQPNTIGDLIDRRYNFFTPIHDEDFEYLETDYNIR